MNMAPRTTSLACWIMIMWIMIILSASASGADLSNSLALVYDDGAGNMLPYRLFLPSAHDEPGASHPLVLFLHGAGERGTDNLAQVNVHIDGLIDATQSEPFAAFLLAPQVPPGQGWSHFGSDSLAPAMDLTLQVVERLETEYAIDASRRYVTGLSMGGFGTFDVLAKRPEFFAAAAPMSGGGDPTRAASMKDVPTWVFHGSQDSIVPANSSRVMVDALRNAGGAPRYTETTGKHGIWAPIYDDPTGELYSWMFDGVAPHLAPLMYNPVNGRVRLDASHAPGGTITQFRMSSAGQFTIPDRVVADGVVMPAHRFFNSATSSVLTYNGTASGGFHGVVDFGEMLPPGLDFVELSALFTSQFYASPSTGLNRRYFELFVRVPEPNCFGLAMMALGGVAVFRRQVHRRFAPAGR